MCHWTGTRDSVDQTGTPVPVILSLVPQIVSLVINIQSHYCRSDLLRSPYVLGSPSGPDNSPDSPPLEFSRGAPVHLPIDCRSVDLFVPWSLPTRSVSVVNSSVTPVVVITSRLPWSGPTGREPSSPPGRFGSRRPIYQHSTPHYTGLTGKFS